MSYRTFLIAAAISLLPSIARGEPCVHQASATHSSDCVDDVEYDGRSGVWVTPARAVLQATEIARGKELARQVVALTAAGQARQREALQLTAALTEQRTATAESLAALDATQVVLAAERERAESVWRSPILWTIVGAAIGGGAVLVVLR